eukprot:CAMPEP_0113703392 /NCGR_PEP_ID=MMETSP0038_2-20120614/25830_1 /TAXON_ID=2898 /ORGANISM="Cryptomonas paramecium" /LENGTH=196 /DNA_ID=CAMNT_0000627841 /DNA_START=375 /DNA_END=961 /DNA_ORIENTATION=+ /assembly_acc=CAM_ASM_000170
MLDNPISKSHDVDGTRLQKRRRLNGVVTRACESCRRAKKKCNGMQPCARCIARPDNEFPASSTTKAGQSECYYVNEESDGLKRGKRKNRLLDASQHASRPASSADQAPGSPSEDGAHAEHPPTGPDSCSSSSLARSGRKVPRCGPPPTSSPAWPWPYPMPSDVPRAAAILDSRLAAPARFPPSFWPAALPGAVPLL